MYFTPLMGFRVDHATMIDVLAHKLLGGLGTKPVRLQKANNETMKKLVLKVMEVDVQSKTLT